MTSPKIQEKMKIYISGKTTGEDIKKAKAKFSYHESLLMMKGYEPINPFNLEPENSICWDWRDCMALELSKLVYCDAIYMLKDWRQSRDARIQYALAKGLGLTIFFEGEFNK